MGTALMIMTRTTIIIYILNVHIDTEFKIIKQSHKNNQKVHNFQLASLF